MKLTKYIGKPTLGPLRFPVAMVLTTLIFLPLLPVAVLVHLCSFGSIQTFTAWVDGVDFMIGWGMKQ